jgi:hypothetical protein
LIHTGYVNKTVAYEMNLVYAKIRIQAGLGMPVMIDIEIFVEGKEGPTPNEFTDNHDVD